MTEKTLTTENIKPALDALRGELAPWPVVAKKQDRLNAAQLNAANSGITSSLVAQIIANTAAIRALESAITGTGLRALVVASLPAVGTLGILYIVPVTTYDPDTDADVVNYSNEYIWIVAPDAPVTEGYYEQVGQTGIVINNGQLTITVNGTSVGTFTANQSGDTTAAITVPTNADYVDKTTAQSIAGVKTFSDGIVGNVTGNVTGNLTGTAAKAIADEDGTSIKTGYVNVAGNQTVSGDKSFTGSNTFNSILPNATNSYALGSSSYQWSSVYAQSYYYNGTEFSSKFVTTDTDQTITSTKTISRYNSRINLNNTNITKGVIPSSNTTSQYYFGDSSGGEIGRLMYRALSDGTRQLWIAINDNYSNGALSPTGTNRWNNLFLNIEPTGHRITIFDTDDVIPGSNNINLGTSTNKWKTLNGINPGALSLPDASAKVQIDIPASWVWDGTTENSYVAPITGWLAIGSSQATYVRLFNSMSLIGSVIKSPISSDMRTYIPMIAGDTILISGITSSSFLIRIYPCLGNV